MNGPRDEREFEAYLAGDSPLSKAYVQQANESPPPELDARILAAAEQELKVIPIQRPWRRWGAAVGIAATVLLAVSVVLQTTMRPQPEGVSTSEMLSLDKSTASKAEMDDVREPSRSAPARMAAEPHADGPVVAAEARQEFKEQVLLNTTASEQLARKASPITRPAAPAAEIEVTALTTAPVQAGFADGRATEKGADEASLQAGDIAPPQRSKLSSAADIDFATDAIVGGVASADLPPAAEAAPEDRLPAAIALIENYQAGQVRQSSSVAEGTVLGSRRRENQDSAERVATAVELEAIVKLYAADQPVLATERLAAFRDRYPMHPVSVRLAEEGY